MEGDFNKSKVGDLIEFFTKDASFAWQNGFYMIVKKLEFPEVQLLRIDPITLHKFDTRKYLSVDNCSMESKNVTLITIEDIINKVNNPKYD